MVGCRPHMMACWYAVYMELLRALHGLGTTPVRSPLYKLFAIATRVYSEEDVAPNAQGWKMKERKT